MVLAIVLLVPVVWVLAPTGLPTLPCFLLLQCLLLAGLLAGILRGRGSAQALVQRKPWVERLRKFTEIATRMAASSKGLSW